MNNHIDEYVFELRRDPVIREAMLAANTRAINEIFTNPPPKEKPKEEPTTIPRQP